MEAVDSTSHSNSPASLQFDASSSDSLADEEVQANSTTEAGADDEVRPSANAENLVTSINHPTMEQMELNLEYFHSAIIVEDLATIKNPRLSQARIADAIKELAKVRGYKSVDHGKEYKFRWTDSSTYYLIKFCKEIGPLYGFEYLRSPRVKKLERSSLISLKWSCILYDLLMSLKFESNVVPTETQIKQRYRYLTETAHPKLFAVTTGDERNPFSVTGADKVDTALEELCRLKNDCEMSRARIQKRIADDRSNKRTVGQMLCSNSVPSVIESIGNTDSEEQSSIDDVNQPNTITVRRNNGPRNVLHSDDFTSYLRSLSEPIREAQNSMQETLRTAILEERKYRDKAQQQKDDEIAIKRRKLEITANKGEFDDETKRQKRLRYDAERLETLVKMMATIRSIDKDDSSLSDAYQKEFQSFLSHYK